MSNDPRTEFQFLDFAPSERTPGPSTIEKIGPSTLGAWMDCNERASEPTNEELGIEPYTGWRLVAAWLGMGICSIAVAIAIAYGLLAVLG